MRAPILLFALTACTSKGDDSGAAQPAPAVSWVSPTAGESVAAGDLACSISVEHFLLVDPAAHSDGLAAGSLRLSIDGVPALSTASTTPTVTIEAGAHELSAQLYYEDGDEVSVKAGRLCEEEESGCSPVVATIDVSAG